MEGIKVRGWQILMDFAVAVIATHIAWVSESKFIVIVAAAFGGQVLNSGFKSAWAWMVQQS